MQVFLPLPFGQEQVFSAKILVVCFDHHSFCFSASSHVYFNRMAS